MGGRLSAPHPSTPSCAPPRVCASGQPAAGSRLDHRRFNGLLFLLRSAVSRKRSASHTRSVPARQGAGPLARHAGRRDGNGGLRPAGATDVHLTTGRMQEHQIPEATIRPDGRGAMVVFVAHLNMPGEVQHVDACGAGFLPPAPATGGFTLPASLAGRLAGSPGTIGWHAGTTQGRERAPPKRCHCGQHPAQDVQAEGTAAGMITVSSDKLRLFLHGHHLVRRPAHAGRAGSRAAPPRNPGDACCDPPVQPDRLARLCAC
jgi:hypothetical protein